MSRVRLRPPGCSIPLPRLRRDWAHPCHVCAGTGLAIARTISIRRRAVLFIQHHKALPQNLAKLLLCAILSDTLNLRSVKLV